MSVAGAWLWKACATSPCVHPGEWALQAFTFVIWHVPKVVALQAHLVMSDTTVTASFPLWWHSRTSYALCKCQNLKRWTHWHFPGNKVKNCWGYQQSEWKRTWKRTCFPNCVSQKLMCWLIFIRLTILVWMPIWTLKIIDAELRSNRIIQAHQRGGYLFTMVTFAGKS